jgi:hypothetical protein
VACLLVVGGEPASSESLAPNGKVTICHATSSQTNPYVEESPTVGNDGDLSGGHLNHTGPVFPALDWGDIIPPYSYVDEDGNAQIFPGSNWSPDGQAIWQHDCTTGLEPLRPILECVQASSSGGFLAHFGYDNPNSDPVVSRVENSFAPDPPDRGQPTVFQPGTIDDAFQVGSTGPPLTWTLTGIQVTASSDSQPCQGSITIVKILHPSGDPGRFNLLIDGSVAGGAAAVGDGGTSGTVAVTTGKHTVSETAAQGTSLSAYATQFVCTSGGSLVAQDNDASLQVSVATGQDVQCTVTNTLKQAASPVVPLLECVLFRSGTPDQAFWGYRNDNAFAVTLPVGPGNDFAPSPQDRGQPTVFEPGTWAEEFATPFNGAGSLTWTLMGQTVTASSNSSPCTGIILLRKVTAPTNDPGVFNLLLNGQVVASGGNGTNAGPYTVGVGDQTVSETAGPGASLSLYDSTINCTRNGSPELSISGTQVDATVGNGDFVVCTFTNRHITTPPLPLPPQPPIPPPPTTPPPVAPVPTPPPTPPNEQVDLAISKTVRPTTAVMGQKLTWTMTVNNQSPISANDVTVVKVSEHSYRTKVLSVTPSQGTCTLTSCDLGRIAAGGSATITVVTLATKIGEILNVVRVGSEEQESNELNNTASALARVIGPFRPPPQTPACRTLGVAPKHLRAGTTSIIIAHAKNRFRASVSGITVHMRAAGVRATATTNSAGIARFTVTPRQAGFVVFSGSPRTAAVARSCTTFLAALKAKPASVTG